MGALGIILLFKDAKDYFEEMILRVRNNHYQVKLKHRFSPTSNQTSSLLLTESQEKRLDRLSE